MQQDASRTRARPGAAPIEVVGGCRTCRTAGAPSTCAWPLGPGEQLRARRAGAPASRRNLGRFKDVGGESPRYCFRRPLALERLFWRELRISLLSKLAQVGRIQKVMEEAARMEQNEPHLGPWIEQVMQLARAYQTRQLKAFLHVQADTDRLGS
ncbi:hypothetical protein WME99_44415 [Sorangium sp. So ce136]|uniref:hypothetical protein n=1 Tax=Sorangium sp. So ce136 TaxID=3133284 RepID=UPI003EFD74E2